MSANEKNYSSYLAYESLAAHVLALFAGFTFTAITVLITRLPDPSQILAQVTLFFLTFVLHIFQLILCIGIGYLVYCVKDAPQETKGRKIGMYLWILGFGVWGFAIVLMFLLWNLIYLASATAILYVLFTVLQYILAWKLVIEHRRKMRSKK